MRRFHARRIMQSRRFNIRARSPRVRREQSRAPFCPKATGFNILSARRFGRRRRCFHPHCASGAHPPLAFLPSPPSALLLLLLLLSRLGSPAFSRLLSLPRGETLIQFHLPLADKLSPTLAPSPPRPLPVVVTSLFIISLLPPEGGLFITVTLHRVPPSSVSFSHVPPPSPSPSSASSARAKRFVLALTARGTSREKGPVSSLAH